MRVPGEGFLKTEGGVTFVCCGWCGKKAFPVRKDTVIKRLEYKCRGSNCKKVFNININEPSIAEGRYL